MKNTEDLFSILTAGLKLEPSSCAGQVVVVTGAGRGIGLQTARAFAMLGADVVLAELSDAGRDAEKLIRAEGGSALFVQTDVSDPAAVDRLVKTTHDHFGPVSVLVNNAIYIQECAVAEMPIDEWDKTIAVNLRGTFLTCRAFLPDMLNRRSGVIINMISTDAMPGLAAYIASKQGITGFSQSLALETGEAGVRVIPFAPGMVDTPGIRSIAGGLAPRLGLQVDQFLSLSLHAGYSGLMPAEHAAAAAVYLALRLPDEFHGQVINGYEVLERAGLLQSPDDIPGGEAAAVPDAGRRELIQKLVEILKETDAEFNRLPVFVRPIARQGFKSKSGRSAADWQRLLQDIDSGLAPVPGNFRDQLEKLSGYYRDVPKETARFTRDVEMLKQVADLCEQRIAVIRKLQELI